MVTLGFALLLASGFLVAKICQRFRLPSVTGYILAGLFLGPSGVNIINSHSVGSNLDHFTNIALMLISFGIGEHVELKKLREQFKTVAWMAACEAIGAFAFVFTAVFLTVHFTGIAIDGWQLKNYIALSLLLASVGLATAPAATLLVTRELKASGPFTASLLAIVAIDNGLAIMIFGFVMAFAQQISGQSGDTFFFAVFINGFISIGKSLCLGLFTGLLLDLVLTNLKTKEEMMTGGLALLLLCSELATYLNLSSLLAGMAAGFILVNKAERDVRIFRALNNFEPPIYVIFFTLAGTHLNIRALGAAGFLGLIYFLARISGKICGAALGARIANAPKIMGRYIGMGLLPQAGVAIGLIFLIAGDSTLSAYSAMITPVVLAGVFISELFGPLTVRFAVQQAGEAHVLNEEKVIRENGEITSNGDVPQTSKDVEIVPWTWRKLSPQIPSQGVVVFGAANYETVAGLARFATIFAHHLRCLPMAVRVVAPGSDQNLPTLFHRELAEVTSMGYPLVNEVVPDNSVAAGLVAAVEYNSAKMVILGYPVKGTVDVLGLVADNVDCPVVVARFYGQVHTERILVPIVSLEDFKEVYPIVLALGLIGEHQVQLLYLFNSEEPETVLELKEDELCCWLEGQKQRVNVSVKVVATDTRVEAILRESEECDLVVIGATRSMPIQQIFFGSLAETVGKKLKKSMLIVYMPTTEKEE
jgi:Kef-type K+ transport system membrane component KefB/nucleotide-binding universal stress UspA family protein